MQEQNDGRANLAWEGEERLLRTCYINRQDEQDFPSKEWEGYLGQRIAKTWSHERAFTLKRSKKLERGRGTTAGPLDG